MTATTTATATKATKQPRKATSKASTHTVTLAVAVAGLKPHTGTAATDSSGNRISIHGHSISNVIKGMAGAGFSRLHIGAMLQTLGLPVSLHTLKTQYGAASRVKPGEATDGHGIVPHYNAYPDLMRAEVEAVVAALDAECDTPTLKAMVKQLKGQRGDSNTKPALPAFMQGK